jgi:RHS repeat-associated protein
MWYLTDKLGSVRENVDSNGNVIDSITYDTYGNILAETHPTSGDRFKYTSREWDSEIGQYFYRARYYSPTDGRFESEDPKGFSAGDTDLYRYVQNDPIGLSDPTGLEPDTVTMESAGAIDGRWASMAPAFKKKFPGKVGRFSWGWDYKVKISDSTGATLQGVKAGEVVKQVDAKGYFKDFDMSTTTGLVEWNIDQNGISMPGGQKNDQQKAIAAGKLQEEISKDGGWGTLVLEQYFVYADKKVIKHSGFAITEEVREIKLGSGKRRYFIFVKKEGAGWEKKQTGFDVSAGIADGEQHEDEIK